MNLKNKLKSLKYLAFGFAGLAMVSWGDYLLDLNVDPTSPTVVPASNLVTQAQFSFFERSHSRVLNGEWGMLMVQHWAQNEYAEESRYVVDGNTFDGSFVDYYAGSLNELKVARQLISDDETVVGGKKANQLAIIDITSAIIFQTLTESWGAIPYSQALSPDFPTPAYDAQDQIWEGILTQLDAAIGTIDENEGSFDTGDIVYNGNMTSWKKLGASLLMRAAMRVADADGALASNYIDKAVAYGLISSNDDNGVFGFSTDPSTANPLYVDNVINNRDDFAVTDVLVNQLKDLGDPRLDVYAAPTNAGTIEGMPYGLTDPEAFALKDVTSRPATVRDATSPHVIMDFAEVSFLLAEAVERGYASGDAAGYYADGVTASMNFWGINDSDAIAAYIGTNGYDTGSWKEVLGLQKWIALYSNGLQAWAEQRRLDQPALALPAAADIGNIPVRLPYPISEQERNEDQLRAVTSSPNDMSTKLWWDVN